MIDGITVLSQEVIMESSVGCTLASAVGAFVLVFVALIILGCKVDGDANLVLNLIAIAALVSAVAAGDTAYHATAEATGRYRYEYLIDESVSAVELNERYIIKEERGEIYVIEDREAQDGNV